MWVRSGVYKLVDLNEEGLTIQLKNHRIANMKLLSTSTTILLSVTLAIAVEARAPIKARQGCSVTMFTGTDFTGTSETFNGDVCVSDYHLSTAGWTQY